MAQDAEIEMVNRLIGFNLGGMPETRRVQWQFALRLEAEEKRAQEQAWLKLENKILKALARMRGVRK